MFPNLCQTNLRWGTQTLRDHGIFAPSFWKVPSNIKIHPPSKPSHVFFHMYFLFYSRTSGCLLTHALWKLKKKKITGKRYFSKFKKETSKPVRGKMSDELSRAERKVMDLLSRKINWALEGEKRVSAGTTPVQCLKQRFPRKNIMKMKDEAKPWEAKPLKTITTKQTL